MPNSSRKNVPDWRDAVAGAGAGAFSKTAMAPVERVKLLLQLRNNNNTNSNYYGRHPTARGVAYEIYKKEGILAFWRGNTANVLRTSGQAALNFMLMDYYKQAAVSPWVETRVVQRRTTTTNEIQRRRSFVSSLISGGMAGGTATTVLYPVEFLRTRLAVDKAKAGGGQKLSMWNLVVRTFKTDGIRGLYQGYGIALFGGIFYRLLYLGGYDAFKAEWLEQKQNWYILQQQEKRGLERIEYHEKGITREPDLLPEQSIPSMPTSLSWTERMIVAQTISLSAGTLCYPIDSVRRRLMMQAGRPQDQRDYRGTFHCIRVVARTEGIRGFYLGILPNMVRSVGGALMLVAYDMIKVVLF